MITKEGFLVLLRNKAIQAVGIYDTTKSLGVFIHFEFRGREMSVVVDPKSFAMNQALFDAVNEVFTDALAKSPADARKILDDFVLLKDYLRQMSQDKNEDTVAAGKGLMPQVNRATNKALLLRTFENRVGTGGRNKEEIERIFFNGVMN